MASKANTALRRLVYYSNANDPTTLHKVLSTLDWANLGNPPQI